MVDSPILRSERPGESARRGHRDAPLPPGYALDASDADVLLLLREDGTAAAAFSARGATAEGILEAAEEDARETKPAADHAGREMASARNGRRP